MYDLSLEELIALAWKQFVPKDELFMYDIITGQIKFMERPYKHYDLTPDIVLRIKLPQQKYAPLKKQPDLSELVSREFKKLSRTYSRAEKGIVSDMSSKREKCNEQQEYIRMFTSIQQAYVHFKSCKIVQKHQTENEQIEIKCQYFKNQQIDLFSIRLNTIVCILQRHCGFRVRSFIQQEKDTKQKAIYMFLSLSQGNLVKAAQAYCIKKEVYPSYIDFYINDPSNSDQRPLKFYSEFQKLKNHIKYNKLIGRYFKEPFDFSKTSSIIEEKSASHNLLSNFATFNESAFQILEDIKKSQSSFKLSDHEKMLIYNYTKKKNMKACYGMFTHHKKRQFYYYLLERLINFHGFKVHKTLRTFKKFFLPNKQSKGTSFKSKVQALILFVPQVVNIQGQLDFFSRMQKTKMCYLKLKNAFKLDFLSKLNYQFFTLSNDYQKSGAAPQGDRYSFTNVVDAWPFHSYFTDIYPIRNYFGNNVSFQILTVISMVQYLTSISMLYLSIFLIQQFNIFTEIGIQYIASALFITGFQAFSTYWKKQQTEFINRYSDQKNSQIFLREYKGPYVRNPLNDGLNEFINTDHSTNFLGNVISTVAISGILAIIGLLFFAARLLLLQLYENLGQLNFSLFSISHIVAYCLYFIVLMIFQEFFGGIIILRLVKFLNPSTEYHQRILVKSITFLFLLGIQFIGPMFFLVIEPLNKTSCLADSCLDELQHYVASRYIFITAFNLLQLAYFALFKRIKKALPENSNTSFQCKLLKMMGSAQIQASKKQFQLEHAQIIVYSIDFAMYCTVVSSSCLYSLLGMFVFHLNMRLKLLYHNRRPIDKSQEILPFSPQLNTIYYFGVIFNSWIVIFGYELVQNYCQFYLEMFNIDTAEGLFLTKLVVVGLNSIGLLTFGECLRAIIKMYRGQSLIKRRNKKIKDYDNRKRLIKVHYKKIMYSFPLKTIFRVYNDDSIVKKMLLEYLLDKKIDYVQIQSQIEIMRTDL